MRVPNTIKGMYKLSNYDCTKHGIKQWKNKVLL